MEKNRFSEPVFCLFSQQGRNALNDEIMGYFIRTRESSSRTFPMHELPQVARFCEASPSQKLDDLGTIMVCPFQGHYTERELGPLQSVITLISLKRIRCSCDPSGHLCRRKRRI